MPTHEELQRILQTLQIAAHANGVPSRAHPSSMLLHWRTNPPARDTSCESFSSQGMAHYRSKDPLNNARRTTVRRTNCEECCETDFVHVCLLTLECARVLRLPSPHTPPSSARIRSYAITMQPLFTEHNAGAQRRPFARLSNAQYCQRNSAARARSPPRSPHFAFGLGLVPSFCRPNHCN